jgi:hypothetical protein
MKGKGERGNRDRGLWGKGREAGGVFGQNALHLPPPLIRTERGAEEVTGAAGRRQAPANRATAADGRWGKMTRAPWGIDSPTYLGLGWCVEAGPRAVADGRWWCSVWRRGGCAGLL